MSQVKNTLDDWSKENSESLSGLIERVTYHNPENGYCVLRVKARGHRDLLTVVGYSSSPTAGEYLQASGVWINNKTHGLQFKAQFLKALPPTTEEGIEKYLASGMIKGIGPIYAKKLVQTFKSDVFDIIESFPEKLQSIEGIGPHRAKQIIKSWEDQKAIRDIMIFLHQHGISTSRAVRIYKTFGAESLQVITQNPYRLARDVRGIGFLSADAIAQKMGVQKDSLIRAQAGIFHVLLEAMDEGHCTLPLHELISKAETLLENRQEVIQEAIQIELKAGNLTQDSVKSEDCVFLKGLYTSEMAIAQSLTSIAQKHPPWGSIDVKKVFPWLEQKFSLALSESQKEAIEMALNSNFLTITGGPGVGKTTLVKSLVTILSAKGVNILLCAPTGRAAKRLSECTNREAKTIHRCLEISPQTGKFQRDSSFPLQCDLLIVDEVSMVDVPLMNALLKALPQKAALFLIGDADQLPSVGPGNVLHDVIFSKALPTVRLTEVFRQAASSRITLNAHRINKGLVPKAPLGPEESDFYLIEAENPEDATQKVLEIVGKRIPQRFKINPTDIQVLCPMNKGSLGARSMNIELQQLLNPHSSLKVERFGSTFRLGDKVMQILNNYDKETYNGDIGFIKHIDPETKELIIRFDERDVLYDFDELDEVVLAYATTIHKSQGSEYPAVVIPLMMQHYPMLKRNLLYTGVTRGKRLVVIVGQKKALFLAVKEKSTQSRWTKLKEALQELNSVRL